PHRGGRASRAGLADGLHGRGRLRDLCRRAARACALGRAHGGGRSRPARTRRPPRPRPPAAPGGAAPPPPPPPPTPPTPRPPAGLAGFVKLAGADFIGRAALLHEQAQGAPRRLVGLAMRGPGIARQGYPVVHEGAVVGEVTSGTHSPTLGTAIALAYVTESLA